MQIAPGIDAVSWQALKLDDSDSPNWVTAVQILVQGSASRYSEALMPAGWDPAVLVPAP
jgi:hypothetical protein